jgi:hypothetical protein
LTEEIYNVGKQNKQEKMNRKGSGRKWSSSVTRHTPEEAADSAHLPQKTSSEFQNEAIYADRYVKEASKELALICRLHAISLNTILTCRVKSWLRRYYKNIIA